MLRENLVKNGAKDTRHAKHVTFQLAKVALGTKAMQNGNSWPSRTKRLTGKNQNSKKN
jgi:hypothetical protein